VFLTTLVAAFFGAVLGRQARVVEGTLAWQMQLERELAEARWATRRVVAERDALLSSPEAIERAAREELGFVAPGEEVVAYEPTVPPQPAPFEPSMRLTRLERLLLAPQLPLVLPASVFLVSAVVFATFNACTRPRGTDGAEGEDLLGVGLPE
jgi:hypothetical protein